MIHYCRSCGKPRECGCGDPCGEPIRETCTECNNKVVLTEAKERGILIEDLGKDPLGGYHIK